MTYCPWQFMVSLHQSPFPNKYFQAPQDAGEAEELEDVEKVEEPGEEGQQGRQIQNNWALETSGSQRFAVWGALRLFLIGTEKIPLNNVSAVKMQRGLADLFIQIWRLFFLVAWSSSSKLFSSDFLICPLSLGAHRVSNFFLTNSFATFDLVTKFEINYST